MIEMKLGGWRWQPICPNPACQFEMDWVEIAADEPLRLGTQCPNCLSLLNLEEVGEALRQANGFARWESGQTYPPKERRHTDAVNLTGTS